MKEDKFLLDKAYRKYRKLCDENGCGFMQHSANNSGCENHDGKEYVVLRNTTNILSVWLVELGGKLISVDIEDFPNSLQEEYALA